MSLLERLRLLPDARRRRGARHPFVAVLLVAASAVVAGPRSYTAIGQWSTNAPQHALARLGARVVERARRAECRHDSADCRPGLPGGLAHLTGADPAGSDSVALDGKAARGSKDFSAELGEPTGMSLSRTHFKNGLPPEWVTGAKVVLKKDPTVPLGYRVLTSYPEATS
ncbi:transposase family protein [Streptomyces mirabilis]|uniref:transposase family protein n=1 Tax=Streptomyces mirabilis TaxID=68239 RepID=UPI003679AC8E